MRSESDSQKSHPQEQRESLGNLLCSLIEFCVVVSVVVFLTWLTDLLFSGQQLLTADANQRLLILAIVLLWGIGRYWSSRQESLGANTNGLTYTTLAFTLSTSWDNLVEIESRKVTRLFWQYEDELKLKQTGDLHFKWQWGKLMQKNRRLPYYIPLTTLDRNWRAGGLGHLLQQYRPDLLSPTGSSAQLPSHTIHSK